jgi:hypothetical protein
MELKIDQEFRDLIPPLSVDEVLNLEQSLLTEGCRDAILTWQNFIIDGHNRYAICTKRGIPFRVEAKQFESRNDVCIWMIQNQFARRNLSNYVRGGLGLKLEEFFKQKAEENLKLSGKLYGENHSKSQEGSANSPNPLKAEIKTVDTREELAKVAGIGSNTISKIKEIKTTAPAEVLSDLEKKLITGEISINQAHKFVRTVKSRKNSGEVAKKILEEFSKNPSVSLENKTKDVIKEIQREERAQAVQEALEKERVAQEKAKLEREERERLEAERLRKEREEKERLEKERLEREKLAREKARQEREAQQKAAKEKFEKEWAENERIRKEKAEQERIEREKREKERAEKAKIEKERIEKERREFERQKKERLEKERLEKEQLEKERLEQKKLADAEAERKRQEKLKLEAEERERKRVESEKREKERLEKLRLEEERLAKERVEHERLEKERLERERIEQERLEKERLEQERRVFELHEKERLEHERLEQERLELERIEKEKLEQFRLEQERIEKEQLEQFRLEQEKLEQERIEKEKRESPIKLIQGDFRQVVTELEPCSVDFIVTDPPYPKEYLPLYEDLAKCAERILKPGGSLLVMIGQSYLPEILQMMTKYIQYHWTLGYFTPGGQSAQLWQKKVNTFWKPVLWFTKGEFTGAWIGDAVKSNTNDNDKRFHDWGQSESGMLDLMKRFVGPSDTVLDPFMGGGTTGMVCSELNCKFIGIEKNMDTFNIARVRLGDINVICGSNKLER